MSERKNILTCDLCGKRFQMGPHRYDGEFASLYKITVCKICWDGNWDGWNPGHEKYLLEKLKENGLPIPERNEKGLLPRD